MHCGLLNTLLLISLSLIHFSSGNTDLKKKSSTNYIECKESYFDDGDDDDDDSKPEYKDRTAKSDCLSCWKVAGERTGFHKSSPFFKSYDKSCNTEARCAKAGKKYSLGITETKCVSGVNMYGGFMDATVCCCDNQDKCNGGNGSFQKTRVLVFVLGGILVLAVCGVSF